MMQIKYQWFYIFLLACFSVCFFYWYDFSPLLLQKKVLLTEIRNLHRQQQMPATIISNTKKMVVTTQDALASDAMLEAHLHNLILKNQTILFLNKNKQANLFQLQLTFAGDYATLQAYLAALQQLPAPVYFTDIHYQQLASGLIEATMVLQRFKQTMAYPFAWIQNGQNPFCHANALQQSHTIIFPSVPLAFIKYIGFSEQDKERDAWLMAPGGHIAYVKINALLGKEHALITEVEPGRIITKSTTGQMISIVER